MKTGKFAVFIITITHDATPATHFCDHINCTSISCEGAARYFTVSNTYDTTGSSIIFCLDSHCVADSGFYMTIPDDTSV